MQHKMFLFLLNKISDVEGGDAGDANAPPKLLICRKSEQNQ